MYTAPSPHVGIVATGESRKQVQAVALNTTAQLLLTGCQLSSSEESDS